MYWISARRSLAPWPRRIGNPVPVSLTPRGKSNMPSRSPISMWVGILKSGSFHAPTWRTTVFVELSSPVGISGAGMFGIIRSASRRSRSTVMSSLSISAMRSPTLRISSLAAAMSPPSLAIFPMSLDAALRFALRDSVSARSERRAASRHFILNTKVSANALIKSAIDEAYNELISPNTLSAFLNQNVVTTELNWRYDEFPIDGKRAQYKGKETLFAHIYYNRTINHNFYSALSHNLARIKEKYMRGESLMPVEQQYFNDYLIVNEETNTVSIDMVKFNEKTKYSGIRVLITDTVKCPIETHQAYDERNQVEYAFNTFKSRLKCFRLRCHTNATLEGKLFIQVLACSLAIMVRNRLAEYKEHTLELKKTISKDFNFIYDSDHKVLAKLNNLQLTKFTNGFYFDEIVGVKKNLLLALGVPLPTAKIDEDEAVLNDTDPDLSQTDEFDFCEY